MTPEYLAGFFDGEGCIDVQRMYAAGKFKSRFYVRPRVRISQTVTSRIVLDGLCERFGGHMSIRKHGKGKQRDSVSWELLNDANMRSIIEVMLPHLILKREQAKLALWWLNNCQGVRSTECSGIDQARHKFADELSAMKHDPQRLSERAIEEIQLMLQSKHGSDAVTKTETILARAA